MSTTPQEGRQEAPADEVQAVGALAEACRDGGPIAALEPALQRCRGTVGSTPSAPVRAVLSHAAAGRYADAGQLHDDCRAMLGGLPLVHAYGGIGRIHGVEADRAAVVRALVARPPVRVRGRLRRLPLYVLVGVAVLVWLSWLAPHLRPGPPRLDPFWAAQAGRDADGAWAILDLPGERTALRFRLVQAGAHPTAGDFWIADRELPAVAWQALAERVPGGEAVPMPAVAGLPVSGVSGTQARAWCVGLALISGAPARLPTLAEWLRAAIAFGQEAPICATGPVAAAWADDGPPSASALWADLDDEQRLRHGPQAPGVSGPAVWHLGGNLAEWCADLRPLPRARQAAAGASWFDPPDRSRPELRRWLDPEARLPHVGFRVVIPVSLPGSADVGPAGRPEGP